MDRRIMYDVVIVGGGTAGVAAAIGAVKTGARTLLIERNAYLGGEATNSGVAAYCGFYTSGKSAQKVVSGVGDMVLQELANLNQDVRPEISAAGNATIKFNPEHLKYAMDRLIEKNNIDLLLHCQVIASKVEDGKILSIECVDDMGKFYVDGKVFVDSTGDGNLAFLSNAQTIWGNETGHIQPATLAIRIDCISSCNDISPGAIEKAILQAKADGIKNLTKEKGFIIRRGSADFGYVLLPSVQIDSIDAKSLTEAEINARKQAHAYIEAFKKYMPGMEKCNMCVTGPSIGIRESRKLVGKYTITKDDVIQGIKRNDGIGRGGWKPEIHKDINKMGEYIEIEEGSFYDIPLGCLQSVNIDNLYGSGRFISADQIAFASSRVMGTCFVTGHAAGVAAGIQSKEEIVDIEKVRAELVKQGAII